MSHEMRQKLEAEMERLERLRNGLSAELDEAHGDPSVTIIDFDQHPGDSGSDVLEAAVDVSVLSQLQSRLVDVEAALHRLDNGSYGRCEVCGTPIHPERLDARPDARLCKEHQEEAELAGRMERLRSEVI
ncbi:MAG: TraR/DksA family transcriptional regulator [Acidimicrobiia bacterium]